MNKTELLELISTMMDTDTANTDRICKHFQTTGLDDLDLTDFLQGLIDAAILGKEAEGWVEPVELVITKEHFRLANRHLDSKKVTLTDEAIAMIRGSLDIAQFQRWVGDETHRNHVDEAANRGKLPLTIPVTDKYGKRVYPDAIVNQSHDMNNPFRGGNSYVPAGLAGF